MGDNFKQQIDRLKTSARIDDVARSLGLAGRGRRVFCPGCQPAGAAGHKTPDLTLYDQGYCCFKCGQGGDVIALVQLARGCDFKQAIAWLRELAGAEPLNTILGQRPSRPPALRTPPTERIKLEVRPVTLADAAAQRHAAIVPVLRQLQANLSGSLGARYLAHRGIPLDLAVTLGLGYAPAGHWPHVDRYGRPFRQWAPWGRLVVPHTVLDATGAELTVSAYGRAIGDERVPKAERHDHLPGPRGVFNAKALATDTAIITEGAFDALALIAAGYPDVCAVFGVGNLPWDSIQSRTIVLALDADSAGGQATKRIAFEGILRNKAIYQASPSGDAKDFSAQWVRDGRIILPEVPKTR